MSRSIASFAGLALLAASLCGCYTPTVNRGRSYHPSDADLTVTRIVHGSLVVDFRGTRILVDPWFSPSPPLGPRETIGIALDKLPAMRGLIVTHRHNDHFDAEVLENYADKSLRVLTVRGLAEEIRAMGYPDVVALEPWEQSQIGDVLVTAVPARHGEEEVGFVLEREGVTAYLAGDTLFDDQQFTAIAARFPAIDVALLPVGGIRILGRQLDMNAEEAADSIAILKPRRVIPYHYALAGPFPFVFSRGEPARALTALLKKNGQDPREMLVVLEPGESWHHYR